MKASYIALILVTYILGGSPQVRAAENLLLNGDFEEWQPQNSNMDTYVPKALVEGESSNVPRQWIITQLLTALPPGYTPANARFAQDEVVKHHGLSSLRIEKKDGETALTVGSRSDDEDWHPRPIVVEPGKSYVLKGWVRGQNLEVSGELVGSLEVRLASSAPSEFFSSGTTRRFLSAPLPNLGGLYEWAPIELPFETKDNETACFISVVLAAGVTGTLWIDDFSLTQE